MSEYIRTNKFDTNECPNIYSWPIYSNIRIYSSHSDLVLGLGSSTFIHFPQKRWRCSGLIGDFLRREYLGLPSKFESRGFWFWLPCQPTHWETLLWIDTIYLSQHRHNHHISRSTKKPPQTPLLCASLKVSASIHYHLWAWVTNIAMSVWLLCRELINIFINQMAERWQSDIRWA